MSLLAKVCVHTQQICGLAWSPNGRFFATGGNDNLCLLFETRTALSRPTRPPRVLINNQSSSAAHTLPRHTSTQHGRRILPTSEGGITNQRGSLETEIHHVREHSRATSSARPTFVNGTGVLFVGPGRQKHTFQHSAAVKAIAFCPWQKGLIATGGGSNDRAIRFYHAWSGACLATIAVHAQVTSLIWSNTRREIAATFGYAQPEHPYRIAVFSWPECRQVVGIPWAHQEHRALFAIPYPGGPNDRDKSRQQGTADQSQQDRRRSRTVRDSGACEGEGGVW